MKRLFAIAQLAACLVLLAFPAGAQQRSHAVRGVVTDATGPVPGVNVVVAGRTSLGTMTGMDGSYSLPSVPVGSVLQFSFVGYATQEVTVGASEVIDIFLVEDTNLLEELVVVGYGTQKKANLTGSVASVTSKDIENIPAANAASLLQGRMPGVTVTSNGAQPGQDTPQIRIRGIGTLSDYNDPMVLIDGVEADVSQISQILPSDIDNVSVLKDAASAAIYGVRAANGVILITTKRGSETDRPTITYSGSYSVNTPTILPKFVDSYNWALLYNESKGGMYYTQEMLDKLKNGTDPDHFANTDWNDAIYQTGHLTQHTLSARGGNKNTHYMISMGYQNQKGIIISTGNDRYNLRSNVDTKVGFLTLGLNLSGSADKIYECTTTVAGNEGDTITRLLIWFTRPTVPVTYSNGEYGFVDGTGQSASVFKNPVQQAYTGRKDHTVYYLTANPYAEVDIIKGLKFRTSFAYRMSLNDQSVYNPKYTRYNAEGQEVAGSSNSNSLSKARSISDGWQNENTLTYNFSIGRNEFNILAGHSLQYNHYDSFEGSKQNFATDNLYVLDAGTENPSVKNTAWENSLQSFFGRINWNYADRYLFEANVRHDGSSRMPKSHRYATFPSVSAGWVLTNESWMPSLGPINYFKLRGSWGLLGNQEIGNYSYTPTMRAAYNYYFGDTKTIGVAENTVVNKNIKWETTRVTDIGFDAALWRSKVNVTFDYFDKLTRDILLRLSMPRLFLGSLDAPYQNVGKVSNKGWEFNVAYHDSYGDWGWNVAANLSSVTNKIVDNQGIEDISGRTINKEGYPIGSWYGYTSLGLARSQSDIDNYKNSEGKAITINEKIPALGDILYKDTNDDGKIDSADREIIGNPFPKLTYSLNLGASWKNLDLTMFWQGIGGIYRFYEEQTALTGGNMTVRWLDRYSANNINGSMPRQGELNNEMTSTFWLERSDYFRLKNLELGYTVNPSLIRKIGIQGARIYLQGTNLLTITGVKNFDAEKGVQDAENRMYPNIRSYSIGVNINF